MTTISVNTPYSFKAELGKRQQDARTGLAYQNYLKTREFVLNCLENPLGIAGTPSQYWQQELAGFDYLFDASPLLIEKLRHHSYHITGLHDYDYRPHHIRNRGKIDKKLKALRKLDKSKLLVSESPALGGFGFEVDGELYNLDTLKYYEFLIGLDKAAILDALKLKNPDATFRPVVMEIGAGWGGFAYQFKTLFPNSTYIIVDLTPTLLFSGTYLKTMFPKARVLMLPSADEPLTRKKLSQYDFVLLPHTAWDKLTLENLDLCLNMVSFQEMTDQQLRQYIDKVALVWKTPYVYSYNRNISPNNPEITGVSNILEDYYKLEELELRTSNPKASKFRQFKQMLGLRKYKTKSVNPDHLYRHIAGKL